MPNRSSPDHRRSSLAVVAVVLGLFTHQAVAQRVFEVAPTTPGIVSLTATLTTSPVWGDHFWCYVANTSNFPIFVHGVGIFDRDGQLRHEDTGPGPNCPRLQSSDQPAPLQPNQTCLVKGTKTVTGGGTKIPDTIAFCRVLYSPSAVTGVRATITARHASFPNDSQTMPAFPQ